jgi:hypothetical protein
VNASCRCFANNSAFSWSLRAQLLGGVVHLRIGGATDVGFLLFRMGFQIELSCLERFAVYSSKDVFLSSVGLCSI